MKQVKSIVGLALLLVGGFALYKVLPVYWANFQLDRMLSDEAIIFTNYPKSDDEIRLAIAQKAQDLGVPISPEDVNVTQTSGELTLDVSYQVHIEMPGVPFDLKFHNTADNHNIMR